MTMLAPTEESILARLLPELKRLSAAARIEVIHQLVDSMGQEPMPAPRKSLLDFVGSWADDPDADAMEAAIRNSRYSEPKPNLENWA